MTSLLPSTDSSASFEAAARNACATTGHAIELAGVTSFAPGLTAARFRLANGLTVLLMADRRAPVFAYQSWFRVGSKDEDPELTGTAHLLEHLMFKGTARFPEGSFDGLLEDRGAESNAATWVDWTYYTQVLADVGDNFSTVVALEADRMVNLAFDAATFASELEVVCNERRMTVDDSVPGRIAEELYGLAFEGHGYAWPTIGRAEHLALQTQASAMEFYQRYYAPNNAIVVVVGSVEPERALTEILRAYGDLPARPLPERPTRVAVPLSGRRSTSYPAPVSQPYLALGFPVPGQLDPMRPALDVLIELAFVGDNARLYRRLVTDERLAIDVEGYLTPFADAGMCEMLISLRPGAEPERTLDAVLGELSDLAESVAEEDLEKARNGLELDFYEELGDAEGCAEALGHYEACFGDYRLAIEGARRIRSVTLADVRTAARNIFQRERLTSVVVTPESDA